MIVEDGNILVTEDGRFYRNKGNHWAPCKITETKGYGVITYTVNGKQYLRYVHRLYTKVFIGEGDERYIMAKDGNYLNLSVDNFYYADDSERANVMWSNKTHKLVNCAKCDKEFHNFSNLNDLCGECSYNQKLIEQRYERRMANIHDDLKDVDTQTLSNRDYEMYKMRLEGATYTKIGDAFNLSSQRVQQIFKKMIDDAKIS